MKRPCRQHSLFVLSAHSARRFMEVDKREKSNVEKQLTLFLGYIKRQGATEKELQTVVDTIGLLRKYLPFYKHQKGS